MPTPEELAAQAAGTQSSSQGNAASASGEEMVQKSRLDGALVKIQELTLANRALADQIVALKGDNATKETTLVTAEAEYKQKSGAAQLMLAELTGKLENAEKGLKVSAAQNRKIEAIKAAGRTDLLSILDVIPDKDTDEDQLMVVKKMAAFATDIASKREKELLAGVTDASFSSSTNANPIAQPTNAEEWERYINTLPAGSPERKQAWDNYFAATNKPKK